MAAEKRYVITPRWFEGAPFEAENAGKAKYMAFKACREALGRDIRFSDFLDGLSVLHMGPSK